MPPSAHRSLRARLVGAAVLATSAAALLLPARNATTLAAAGLALAWALLLLARAFLAARRLGRGIAWTRTAVLNVVADRETAVPRLPDDARTPEIVTLLKALGRYQDQVARERRAPDRRLLAVLGAMAGGVAVITDTGQVSLINAAARDLLGAERARVGTSVFAALDRRSLGKALGKARDAGRPLETAVRRLDGVDLQVRAATLPDDEGAVLIFPEAELALHRPEVEFDLDLHDVPPATEPLTLDTPLADLPVLVIDTETTGLSPADDRVVSLGAVGAHGTRLYPGHMIDDLVAPGVPIPEASTAVHGITDAMVADAQAWPEAYAELRRLARNRLVVGHSVPFDLTVMRRECERHGLEWRKPYWVDTLRLASLLNPALRDLSLESLADVYHIELRGRHTALGDALVAAELFFRMLPRLELQGFATLGDLLRYHCTEPVHVIAQQREAGWDLDQPGTMEHA